jgi:hypothetical protein
MPSERLRRLEVDANSAFEQYREMYFEGGVSSVYLWDLEHGFAGRLLLTYEYEFNISLTLDPDLAKLTDDF